MVRGNVRGRTHYFHPSENSVKPQFQAPQGFGLIKGLSGDVCTCKESFHLVLKCEITSDY